LGSCNILCVAPQSVAMQQQGSAVPASHESLNPCNLVVCLCHSQDKCAVCQKWHDCLYTMRAKLAHRLINNGLLLVYIGLLITANVYIGGEEIAVECCKVAADLGDVSVKL